MTAVQGPEQVRGGWTRTLTLLWALLPLGFGVPAGPTFAWAAWRLRSQALAVEAAAYMTLTVVWITMVSHKGAGVAMGTALALLLAGVACWRAFVVRRRLLNPASSRENRTGVLGSPTVATDPNWSPSFPARSFQEQGQSIAAAFACDGQDRHRLGMPPAKALSISLSGGAVIAAAFVLHLSARAMGAGIGLVLAGLIAVLFARWVDGPVLYYRKWGLVHQLPLTSVTAVKAAGRRSVALSAPGLTDPVKIHLRNRYYVMPSPARDHLHGWLSSPQVQWAPEAAALFDDFNDQTVTKRRSRSVLIRVLVFAISLAAVGIVAWVYVERTAALAIPGATGYSTFTGPEGKPLPIGRPWGRPCQPIRFAFGKDVPGWAQTQGTEVVNDARADGIDVTMEMPNYTWATQSLYYASGQSPATSVVVGIFSSDQSPPHVANGQPEHIALGWDAQADPNGHNEDLTTAQGILQMRALDGDPQVVRRSIRQLIAMTQGILSTTRSDSGITSESTIDQFTSADVAAMKLMSGCV